MPHSTPLMQHWLPASLISTVLMTVIACGGTHADSESPDPESQPDLPEIFTDQNTRNTDSTQDSSRSVPDRFATPQQSVLVSCNNDLDCDSDEACTEGGHCVDITGQHCATKALQADIDNLGESAGMGAPYGLPDNAILQLNDIDGNGIALDIDKQILLNGNGSLLVVDSDITAIRLGPFADWSKIRDLRIDPQHPDGAHSGVGIDIRAHGVRLDNLYFWRMGTGVRAHTTVDGEIANINSQQWSRLVFDENHNHAVDLRGGDANAGVMTGLEVLHGAGIYDRSFLGNTYVGPRTVGAHTHSVTTDSDAGRNLVLGAHVDDGDVSPQSGSNHDLIVGGNAVGRFLGNGERVGDGSSSLRFSDRESGLALRIPASEHSPIAWKHPDEDQWWFLRYWDHPSLQQWGFSYQNSGTAPFFWNGDNHPDGPGHLQFNDD